jgi:hypothetical protein
MDRRSVIKGLLSFFGTSAVVSSAWAKNSAAQVPDIAPTVAIPSRLLTLVRSFKGSANGKVYIGQVGTDPLIPANQVQVYLEKGDGAHVAVTQPLVLDASGSPIYDGQSASFVAAQGHSMAVYDSNGAQQFYVPDVLKYDPDIFHPYFDEKISELRSPAGADQIGHRNVSVGQELDSLAFIKNRTDIFYATFFESNTTVINLVTSHDGVNWSDPTRLSGGKNPIADRDPSICFFKDSWYIAVTANSAGNHDMRIYTSDDLINWKPINIKLDGDNAICSRTRPWDSGTRPADKLWAPELVVEDGELYVIISIYLGYDTTSSPGATANFFGTYVAKCTDINTLQFTVLSRIDFKESDGSMNKYSRIDADIAKDEKNNRYLLAVKRENYGVIDVFHSSSFLGPFTFNGTVSMSATGEKSGYLMKSGIEGPSLFQLKTGEWALAFDPNNTFDGITYVTSRDGFVTYSTPEKFRLPKLRHGTIKSGMSEGLTAKGAQDLYKCRTAASAVINTGTTPANFIRITENCSIIPQSDTVYWVSESYTVKLITPKHGNFPRNFYFCVRSTDRSVVLRITGAVAGGVWDIGWGISNERIIEFFYENLKNVYRCEIQGAPSYKSTRLSVSAGGNNINDGRVSWVPQHGLTYIITESDRTCTLYSLPNMPVGTYFNVVIQSAENSFVGLVIKASSAGNNLGLPVDFSYSGGADNYDGRIIRIEKGSELWFATK